MEQYIFTHISPSTKENVALKFEIEADGGVQIQTFHKYCNRAALAFGYTAKNTEEVFGDTYFFEDFF